LEEAISLSEMEDHIVRLTFMPFMLQNVVLATNQFVEIVSMPSAHSGIQSTFAALTARNHLLEEASSNLGANHTVRSITINRQALCVPGVANLLLVDASMLLIRNGTLNTLCVPSV
jgi:hypothetical protein